MKCSTVGCRRPVGAYVIQWPDLPDEPVCDWCARYYGALQSTAFTVAGKQSAASA